MYAEHKEKRHGLRKLRKWLRGRCHNGRHEDWGNMTILGQDDALAMLAARVVGWWWTGRRGDCRMGKGWRGG